MLILASASPRRRELLQMLGMPFSVCSVDTDESYPDTLAGEQIPIYISRLKAEAYGAVSEGDTLITADTIVWLDGKVYGKPHDAEDARRILRALSGKTHQVITGVTLRSSTRTTSFASVTDVHFAPLTDGQIDYYITRYKPFDKAGAYGIQEWIGAVGISGITGSYYNVMGLPVHRLYKELANFS